VLTGLREEVTVLTAKLEAVQAVKIEADRAIAATKDEIADCKSRAHAGQRTRDVKERELREAQDALAVVKHEAGDRSKAAEGGATELAMAQDALRRDKAALDRCLKEYDKLRGRSVKLVEELEDQMRTNQTLAQELNGMSEAAAGARARVAAIKKEAERVGKLHALALEKVGEAESRRAETEARASELRRAIEEADGSNEAARRQNEVKRTAVGDVRREKDVLTRALGTAGDKSKAAEEAVALQDAIRRSLTAELAAAAASMKALRGQLDELAEARLRYAAQCEEAQAAYFTAMEGVKLQELQMAALQRKIEEGNAKLKQQQSLYDAVRADRNMYSKNLADANAEMAEMRRMYKQLSHTIESVKGDIEAKDGALIREHVLHARVEKEKEALRNEVTRIQKQVQSCEQILASQEAELAKLAAIIAEADTEKARQTKEYEAVVAERNLLQGQLVKRDAELSALYEKLRVQKSSLANGAAAYARSAVEFDDLTARLAAMKGELLVAATQTGDVGALEGEAKRLGADLRAGKAKIRALTEELERPINIHRWRALADRDPERWAIIQRVQALQKRVLEARDDIRGREAAIAEKEKVYAKLKATLGRQPGPELRDTIATYAATVKAKTKQLRSLEGELETYRGRVEEYRRELGRVNERLEEMAGEYVRRQRVARKRMSTAGGGGGGAAGGAGRGFDEAALLDVSAEMAAGGGNIGPHLPPPHLMLLLPRRCCRPSRLVCAVYWCCSCRCACVPLVTTLLCLCPARRRAIEQNTQYTCWRHSTHDCFIIPFT